MVSFWINNHSISSLFLSLNSIESNVEEDFALTKEDIIRISLEMRSLGFTIIEYIYFCQLMLMSRLGDWLSFTSEYTLLNEDQAML